MKGNSVQSSESLGARLLDRYVSFSVNKPWILLLFTLLTTAFFGFKLSELKVDSTPYFMDGDHPERREEAVVRSLFTSTKEQAFVLVVAQGQDIYNLNTLTTIDKLSHAFENLSLLQDDDAAHLESVATTEAQQKQVARILENGIQVSDLVSLQQLLDSGLSEKSHKLVEDLIIRVKPVHRVRSLTQIENLQGDAGSLDVGPLVDGIANNAEFFQDLKRKVAENTLYHHILVSDDHRAANIQIEFNVPDYDSPNLVKAHQAVLDIIDAQDTRDAIHFGGTPVVNAEIVHVLERDNGIFFPLVILIIAFILYISFRRFQGIWIPLLIAILSVVWAMGFMSMLGIKQNVVTTALPVFLISIAVCDSIHYLSMYYQKLKQHDKQSAIQESLKKLFSALFFTSLTTMIGFYSLTITELVLVKEFGIVMIAGVFFAFVLTIVLLPALLQLTEKSQQGNNHNTAKSSLIADAITALIQRINRFSQQKHSLLLVCVLVFSALVGYLSSQIRFDQHNTSSFDKDTRLRIDDAVLNQHLGGTSPLNISFHASTQGAFTQVDVIRALDKIEQHLLEQYPTLGYASSPVGYLKRIHQVLTEAPEYALPRNLSSDQIAQYYLLYETSNGQEIRNVLDDTYSHARIALLGHTDQASEWKKIIRESDAYIKSVLPAGISYHFSGVGNIQKANLDEVISSQMNSLVVGVIFIFAAMVLATRSLLLGFIGVIPLALTLVSLFAFMAVMDIHLDIGTGLIAALVFGIGVDYSIHFFTQFKNHYHTQGKDLETAISDALTDMGAPVVINSLSLAAGFLVLSLSSYSPLAYLGMFVAGAMVLCAVWVLFLVPMLLRTFWTSKLEIPSAQAAVADVKD